MKMVYTIAAMLLAANVAVAQNNNTTGDISEFHQHAMMGQFEITPHVDYLSQTSKVGTTDIDASGFTLGSEFEYGVMERLSVGAALGYQSVTVDLTPEVQSSGLQDVTLFTRGSRAMGIGRLAYGADLGVSLGNAETEANGDTNAMSGGMSLAPYVGYEMMAGPGVWGAQLNYTWLGERTDESSGVETKTEGGGGVGLATFYEYGLNETTKLGGALTYAMDDATETAGTSNQDKSTTLGLQVYAPIKTGADMTIIPRFGWAKVDPDTAGAGETTLWTLGAALRWMM